MDESAYLTESESLARLTSSEFIIELMNRPRHGYFICDQGKRPPPKIGDNHFPDTITRIWREDNEWIWEFHFVVPGPGPKRRYPSLDALVDDVLSEFQKCREAAIQS
jgi:hypothetical protein